MLDEQERTVTFVLKFKQKDVPIFMWESLMGKPQSEIPGCRVVAIGEGDMLKESERYKEALEEVLVERYVYYNKLDPETNTYTWPTYYEFIESVLAGPTETAGGEK